jgi:hypothetical protein
MVSLGFTKEATNFGAFLQGVCARPNPDGSLQIMHGIDRAGGLVGEQLQREG